MYGLCCLFGLDVVQGQTPPKLVWPLPPENPRIEYLYSLSGKADLGIEKSFLRKIWEFIIGAENREERIVQPSSVALDFRGRILVTDPGAGCVHVFDVDDKSYSRLNESTTGQFQWPLGIAVAPDGRVYVSDALRKEIVVLSPEGEPLSTINGLFDRPTGIAIKGDRLYVIDTPLHKILAFSLNGEFLFDFGIRGSSNGEFNFPVSLAVSDNLFVIDAMNHRVQVLSDSGKFLYSFGNIGNVPGTFANPKGVALDSRKHVYVVDALFDAFQIFDTEGTLLLVVGESGSGAGQFQLPSAIATDSMDRIYVVDSLNRRVQVFRYLD